MQDISLTIIEYEASCNDVDTKISTITKAIKRQKKGSSGLAQLMFRRDILQDELISMQYAIKQLKSYQNSISREVVTTK